MLTIFQNRGFENMVEHVVSFSPTTSVSSQFPSAVLDAVKQHQQSALVTLDPSTDPYGNVRTCLPASQRGNAQPLHSN
jgi:hypothetical protein